MMAKRLKVYWIPQIPMDAFEVDVQSVEEAVRIMDILADYDRFQFENKVKPDYCNVGGLVVFEGGEWIDWYDDETETDDPREYLEIIKARAA